MGRRLVAVVASAAAAALVVTAGVLAKSHLFGGHHQSALAKYMPLDGDTGESLDGSSTYWTTRLSYPTGRFNPDWVRRAVAQDAQVPRAAWTGKGHKVAPGTSSADSATVATPATTGSDAGSTSSGGVPTAAPTAPFISLGPQPLRMTGCSGCYNYTSTEGRMNAVAVDPTTTTNGSIVAYAASVGGGVWKTTTCCTADTTWSVTTDDPMINTTSIDALAIDPHDHNTIYAGTGDLNYGSFSMGSQGILKSTDGGAHWTVLGQSLFGMQYVGPAGTNSYPQYQAVGKVAVDPNNSNNVVAGTKSGLYFSYDAGSTWTGPCLTNGYVSQRQDITGLILTDMGGGSTRILAANGTRGITTGVQPDLGLNGANGVYSSTMQSSGCPGFTLLTGNDNGFVFGTQVTGSPYTTGAPMNGGSGTPYSAVGSGNQLGRIDLAVAPSDPDTIYAQVQSEAINANSGCGSAQGCQLGVWASIDGGTSWSFLAGSAGGSLRNCSNGQGDYNQNWYDQGVAVDPNNPDRILVDTFDVWSATRTGTSFFDLSCGYSYSGSAGQVHTDQHAITYVPGNSSFALFGNDGGLRYSTNVDAAFGGTRPTFNDLNNGINSIEFYSGDISANFFTSAQPYANGGAQDNGSSTAIFNGAPTGPVQWQMGLGGDGFFARIDPVANVLYQGGNSGSLTRCTSGVAVCTGPSQSGRWSTITGPWTGDTLSFILPYDIYKGTPGNASTDCATACDHIIAASTRVWETTTASTMGTSSAARRAAWIAVSPNLVKGTLGNRSYINQLAYSPATSSLAIAGTSDGNVQVGLGMGKNAAATWVDLTGGNTTLPNRPMLDVAFDPRSLNTTDAPIVGYAAVGGFNSNTPATPGHVYQVTCAQDCASSTWADKTGNLPDIPADSIIVNPKDPQQVYVGTDIGLYVTDDVTAPAPTWYKLQTGLPNVMIWDLQIDRGSTALSVWTRSRGAYVWPLPSSRLVLLDQTIAFAPIGDHTYGDPDFDVSAVASSGVDVTYVASGDCTISGATVHITGAGSCTVTASAAGNLDYNPAPDASQTFAIAKEPQSISIDTPTPKHYGDADFDITATATSGLPVSLDASGKCTLSSPTSPATVHITGGGECVVTASQAGDDNWQAAPNEVRTFEIDKADQTISFGPIADHTYGESDFTVAATSSSGLDVGFRATGGCTVDGSGTVHITGAGSCTVTAFQAGNDDYNPAPDVPQTFAIAQATQTIAFAPLADKTFGDGDFALAATASSGLAVAYAASGDCSVSGATVHIDHAGSCTVTASQPGDANYQAAASVDRTFAIARQPQSISFAGIGGKTVGDADFQVAPTSSLGLPVYVVATSGPCTVAGVTAPVTVHVTGAGTCVLTATQDGDGDHAAAAPVSQSFAIAKGSQTITFSPLADRVFGGPFAVTATSSAGLVVTLTAASGSACTVDGATVTMTGVGKCTIVASQGGNQDYTAAASVTRSFTISNSRSGNAFGVLLRPATGGTIVFSVTANAPGPKGLSGTLVYEASHGLWFRPTPALHFTAKTITAFGLGADGHSAWFAGVGTNGQPFVAYAADSTTRRLFRRKDGDVFQLWVGGVLQTGDGTLLSGNVIVTR